MKPLVIIPARSGSKGVPGKNWKLLNNKPLIQYTIEAALNVFKKESICITTDSSEVKLIAEKLGLEVPFERPENLSNDTATTEDVILHALNFWKEHFFIPDYIVFLQPTSPFRTSNHIKNAISLFNKNIDMVVSVKETRANPYYILREENEEGYLKPSKKANFSRRQDCPKVYELNGAIYVINIESLKMKNISKFNKIIKFEMDELSSIDIDNETDWLFAEIIADKKKIYN